MSKAFTRESDDAPEVPTRPRTNPILPAGAKNYLTPAGALRMQEELDRLLEHRSSLAGASDKQLELVPIEARITHLQESLGSAEVVPKPNLPWDQVRFGATVQVREKNGDNSDYRIVGVDETDIDRGWVSWLSPIARALLNGRLGQKVKFHRPSGDTELEIVSIAYD